ncbi:hypothetical protein BJX65DRAFT_22184 [Aspergillus insuetus]
MWTFCRTSIETCSTARDIASLLRHSARLGAFAIHCQVRVVQANSVYVVVDQIGKNGVALVTTNSGRSFLLDRALFVFIPQGRRDLGPRLSQQVHLPQTPSWVHKETSDIPGQSIFTGVVAKGTTSPATVGRKSARCFSTGSPMSRLTRNAREFLFFT